MGHFLTSSISRSYIFGPVRLCVHLFATGPREVKYCTDIKYHHILDEFESQGYGSNVKVSEIKKCHYSDFQASIKVIQGQGLKVQDEDHQGLGQGHKVKMQIF